MNKYFFVFFFFYTCLVSAAQNSIYFEIKNSIITQTGYERCTGVLGIITIILIAYTLSADRKSIPWRLVFIGLALQVGFGYFILYIEYGRVFFESMNVGITNMLSLSNQGAGFVFGNLVSNDIKVNDLNGGVLAFVHTGAMFAFSVLPTIVFFSSLTAVLYHIKVLHVLVNMLSYIMRCTMGTSGAESFSAAANIFVGQTEAPLLIKPYLAKMTNSEIMAVMTGGFSNVSGGIMGAYIGLLASHFPDIASHLMIASVMSAPASLVFAKIIFPESQAESKNTGTQFNLTNKDQDIEKVFMDQQDINILDAAARGTADGLLLALNVAAMLISFISLVACVNLIISGFGLLLFGYPNLSLEMILGVIFCPLAWLLGVPWDDAQVVGRLLGVKTVLNELIAYTNLADCLNNGTLLRSKSVIIATYALCGFANFSSIGIQVGGLSNIEPSRRADFAKIAFKAMIAGSLVTFQTAAIVGILI